MSSKAEIKRDQALRVPGIGLAIIALAGLIGFFGKMSPVNAGIFLYPGILAAALLCMSKPKREKKV